MNYMVRVESDEEEGYFWYYHLKQEEIGIGIPAISQTRKFSLGASNTNLAVPFWSGDHVRHNKKNLPPLKKEFESKPYDSSLPKKNVSI